MEHLTDKQIVERILLGKIDDFEELMKRYNGQFFRIAIAYLENPEDAEDAMQTAYLKIFEKLGAFSWNSALGTWMIRVLINECKMILRKRKYRMRYLANVSLKLKRKLFNTNSESMLVTQELRQFIERSILDLPSKYKVVYTMKEINGYSIKETAELLALSESNVKVRLHRAKDLLKNKILEANAQNELFDYHLGRCNIFRNRVMQAIRSLHFVNS